MWSKTLALGRKTCWVRIFCRGLFGVWVSAFEACTRRKERPTITSTQAQAVAVVSAIYIFLLVSLCVNSSFEKLLRNVSIKMFGEKVDTPGFDPQ